ncbi:MAG TPA: STAS domain-containing protein [Bryobacteraceae bacterium]|nr:STAS domain-containing protein [Bryobacteraceae bacterium]
MHSRIPEVFDRQDTELLAEWKQLQTASGSSTATVTHEGLLRHAREFVSALREATRSGSLGDTTAPQWNRVRDLLSTLSREGAEQGFSPIETASFVFSFKQPLFNRLRDLYSNDAAALAEDIWQATVLLDELGLLTTSLFQKSREQIIARQQQELLELSTPVVQLWEGVLALPLIGTLDSARTQVVMQNLLEAIVSSGAAIAIIDITGVPTVDTLVAQHLLKTVAAARLMGADCIISGIRPQIAQTIIHLGVELNDVTTKATLAGAFQVALRRLGMSVARAEKV